MSELPQQRRPVGFDTVVEGQEATSHAWRQMREAATTEAHKKLPALVMMPKLEGLQVKEAQVPVVPKTRDTEANKVSG